MAKLRLPAFTYDEIDRLVDRSDYCKFGNIREVFIFANSVKRHICDVKILRLGLGLLISVNERVISPGFYFHETSHMRSFAKIKPSRKFTNLQYLLLETDTDNLYMALSKPTLDEVVKPHLKDEYLKTMKDQCKDGSTPSLEYLPRSCCSKHVLFDKREPDVFKTEFIGDGIIGLCSKVRVQRSRIDTIKYHIRPRLPMGK